MADEWHLDKRVPLALIITIVLQSMCAVWWAASMQARIDGLEKMLATQEQNQTRLARLEQVTVMQTRALDRIEDKLDRIYERGGD